MQYLWPVLGCLFLVQILEGTKALTSVIFCGFILVMVQAFNRVGGLVYPSGAYIFFVGTLTVTLGGVAKTVLGESLDSHMFNAQKSLLVYLVGACSIWLAAWISTTIRRKRPFLQNAQLTSNFMQAAVGAALVGQFGMLLVPKSYVSTFNQLNQLLPLSLILSVYATTRKTDGERSFSFFSFVVWVVATTENGLFTFSKQGLFTPALCWALGATIAGYRITFRRAIVVGVLGGSMALFFTPISQIGRVYRDRQDSQERALDLLMHPLETRELYTQVESELDKKDTGGYRWFDHNLGLLDRLTLFPIDDALIHRTDAGFSPGILPIQTYAINMIPRYLVKEKLVWSWGNRYAHEIGMLGRDDNTTGISFSPFADLYHEVQWWGLTVVCLPMYVFMFWFCDSLTGSIHDTIWASLYILLFSHNAAEAMFWGPFQAISIYAVMVVLLSLLSRYILPILGGLFFPPARGTQPGFAPTVWKPSVSSPMMLRPARTIEEKL